MKYCGFLRHAGDLYGDVHEDFEGFAGFQEVDHFLVFVEAVDGVGEDFFGDAGVHGFSDGEHLDALSEVIDGGVDAAEHEFVSEDPFEVDAVSGDFDFAVAAGDAGEDHGSVEVEVEHAFEDDFAIAGGFDDEIGVAELFGEIFERCFFGADVVSAVFFSDLGFEVSFFLAAGDGEDAQAFELEHHGGEESDLS